MYASEAFFKCLTKFRIIVVIVHCIVVNKCSLCPRWKFNLTVSVKYWYINEGMRAFLVWNEILGGDCWNYGLGPFILFIAIKEFKAHY